MKKFSLELNARGSRAVVQPENWVKTCVVLYVLKTCWVKSVESWVRAIRWVQKPRAIVCITVEKENR